MFKYINTAIIGAMCLLAGACSGDEPATDTSASGSGAAVTIPVNFSVGLNDFGSSRSSFDEWPDGATVMMYSATTSSVYGFISYSASSNQWTATFTTAPASGENQPCRLYYVPGWTASDYSTTSTVSTLPTVPNYAATTTYDYVNDELNLFGVLEPLTGRLRLMHFVSMGRDSLELARLCAVFALILGGSLATWRRSRGLRCCLCGSKGPRMSLAYRTTPRSGD